MNTKLMLAAIAITASAAMCHAQDTSDEAPVKTFTKVWTADQGDGTYINPVVNADFPDIDLLRVGDTYYMMTTTMYHFPGATILKSKDLVNWEFCCNPLEKIDDNDAYNLLNGKHHYSQGQWATSLKYHNGKFYLYFICYGRSGVDNTQQILLTTTDIEGAWDMTKMQDTITTQDGSLTTETMATATCTWHAASATYGSTNLTQTHLRRKTANACSLSATGWKDAACTI